MSVCNRQKFDLYRSKPNRECTCILFDKKCKRSFVTTDWCSVNNIRIFLSTVFINVFHTEFFGKHLVDLDCYKSIFLTVYILNLNIKFRAVECSLTDTDFIINVKIFQDFLHRILCFVPLFFCTDILFSVVRIPFWETIWNVFD